MQAKTPQIRRNFDSYAFVKDDEKISIKISEDWLPQVKAHLEAYLAKPRHKNRNHRGFAQSILEVIRDTHPLNPGGAEKIILDSFYNKAITIFPLGSNKPKLFFPLSERGSWDNKRSWLYMFCNVALQNHHTRKTMQQMDEELKGQWEWKIKLAQEEKLAAEQKAKELESELTDLTNLLKEKNKQLADQQLSHQSCYQAKDTLIAKKENEKLDLKTKLEQEKENTNKTNIAKNKLQVEYDTLKKEKENLEAEFQSLKGLLQVKATESYDQKQTHDETIEKLRKELKEVKSLVAADYKIQVELDAERDQTKKLKGELQEANEKISQLERILNLAMEWLDTTFSKVFGDLPSKLFNNGKKPSITPTQEHLIQSVITARSSDINNPDFRAMMLAEARRSVQGKSASDLLTPAANPPVAPAPTPPKASFWNTTALLETAKEKAKDFARKVEEISAPPPPRGTNGSQP